MRRNLSSGIKVDMYASMHGFIMDQKFKMFRFFLVKVINAPLDFDRGS